MGRRVLNRKEMRNDYDAAERRNKDEEELDEDEETDEEDDEEEEGDEESDESDDEESSDDEDSESDDEDEEAPKKKKAKAKVAKPKAKPRTRTPKVVRMRVVWGVFSNSNQMVASYEYPKKAEAVAHAERLQADKKSTHFVQPVKEPMEEKKEK